MCEPDRYNSSDSVYVGERFGMFVDKPNGWVRHLACAYPRDSRVQTAWQRVPRSVLHLPARYAPVHRPLRLRNGRDDADVEAAPLMCSTLSAERMLPAARWLSPSVHPALLSLRDTHSGALAAATTTSRRAAGRT